MTAAPNSVAEKTYDALMDMVLSRALAPGQVIEERRLADRLHVSRTPLRSAVSRLLGEGMLARLSNGTTVVRETSVTDFLELLQVRRLIEGEAAARAAGKITAPSLADLRERLEGLIKSARAAKEEHWTLDDELHDVIAAACGNRALAEMIAQARRRVRLCNIEREPGRLVPACQEHIAIIDALASGDGDRARKAMVEHLDNVRRAFLRILGLSGEAA